MKIICKVLESKTINYVKDCKDFKDQERPIFTYLLCYIFIGNGNRVYILEEKISLREQTE